MVTSYRRRSLSFSVFQIHRIELKRTYHFFQGELTGAGDHVAVEGNAGAPVEKDALPVTSPEVGEEVAAAGRATRSLHQVYSDVGLAHLKVRAGTVDDELDAVQAQCNVSTIGLRQELVMQKRFEDGLGLPQRVPQFFADFKADARVERFQNGISERDGLLPSELFDELWEDMLFHLE